ncbi:hypothetical protein G2W53_004169 [Senna tora]|uniref:Uncharacterized protein n=1 Tax=Senna tora TaxID=362788 RepID=A0A835CGB9_9FABA|nr:hypothetical protein G2W53_004169 [Senna tora]
MDQKSLKQAHRYILFNCDGVQQYIREHEDIVNSHIGKRKWSKAKRHSNDFIQWFETRAMNDDISDFVKGLSKGPNTVAKKFSGYVLIAIADDGEVDLVRTDVPATTIGQPLPTLDEQPHEKDYEEDSDFDDILITEKENEDERKFERKSVGYDRKAESPSIRNGFNFNLQAEVQQSNEAPHVPKKLKRKPICPPLSMDDFLGNVESDIEEIMMNEEVEQNEEDNNHHNEVEEENNGDITEDEWRRYKCKIKKLHFEKFVHMTERLKHYPATIPESQFKKLCLYWSNENVKSQLKDHLTQNPEQNHTEAFKEVFGKEKAGRVRCYGRNVTPTALKQKEKQNQIMDSMKSFTSEANNAQNVEGQSNEHSTTLASSPDKVFYFLTLIVDIYIVEGKCEFL